MKLLLLVSCFCLQLASAPAAKAYCLDGQPGLKAPDSTSIKAQATAPEAIEPATPLFLPPATPLVLVQEQSASFPGSKEFFIRTGLSPPLVVG